MRAMACTMPIWIGVMSTVSTSGIGWMVTAPAATLHTSMTSRMAFFFSSSVADAKSPSITRRKVSRWLDIGREGNSGSRFRNLRERGTDDRHRFALLHEPDDGRVVELHV